jgi:hypothetical protein
LIGWIDKGGLLLHGSKKSIFIAEYFFRQTKNVFFVFSYVVLLVWWFLCVGVRGCLLHDEEARRAVCLRPNPLSRVRLGQDGVEVGVADLVRLAGPSAVGRAAGAHAGEDEVADLEDRVVAAQELGLLGRLTTHEEDAAGDDDRLRLGEARAVADSDNELGHEGRVAEVRGALALGGRGLLLDELAGRGVDVAHAVDGEDGLRLEVLLLWAVAVAAVTDPVETRGHLDEVVTTRLVLCDDGLAALAERASGTACSCHSE